MGSRGRGIRRHLRPSGLEENSNIEVETKFRAASLIFSLGVLSHDFFKAPNCIMNNPTLLNRGYATL
jgi:hypothetical protein